MALQTEAKGKSLIERLEPILIVAVFAIVCGVSYVYILDPLLKEYLPGGKYSSVTLAQELQDRKKYQSDLEGVITLLDSSQNTNIKQASLALPAEKDLPTLYALYEKIVKTRGLSLQAIDIVTKDIKGAASNSNTRLKEVNVTLRVGGARYAALKQLVRDIEQSLRVTDIASATFDPKTGTIELSVKTYYLPNKAQ